MKAFTIALLIIIAMCIFYIFNSYKGPLSYVCYQDHEWCQPDSDEMYIMVHQGAGVYRIYYPQ